MESESLTARELAGVIAELRPALAGAAIARILETRAGSLVLEFGAAAETKGHVAAEPVRVFVGLESGRARIHRYQQSAEGGRPARGLESIGGAILEELQAIEGDRCAIFAFRAGERSLALRFELFSARPNWVLVEQGIVAAILHPVRSRSRVLETGSPDVPPVLAAKTTVASEKSRFLAPGARFECNDSVAAYFEALAARDAADSLRAELLQAIRRKIRTTQAKIEGFALRIQAGLDTGPLVRRAQLLSAERHNLPRGAASVTLTDYFDPAMPQITIELDPAVDLSIQIERLFAKAKRLEAGVERARIESARAEKELRLARDAETKILAMQQFEGLAALRDETQQSGLLPRPARARPRGARNDNKREPFWRFRSRDGFEILVGRSAADNARLTFQVAHGEDLWLHAAGVAGSHVVVRTPRAQGVTSEALLDAAALAVHFSKSRGAGRAEVRYTQRKFVSRPRGAPPGLVAIAGEKSLVVDLDRARLERLLRPGGPTNEESP
jgi:predicted ribosome quality control (RQC) complex YloA/Tae2 family protein